MFRHSSWHSGPQVNPSPHKGPPAVTGSVGVGLVGIVLPAEEGSVELVGSVLAIEGSSVGPVDEGSIVDPVEEGLEVGEPMEEVGDWPPFFLKHHTRPDGL